MSRQLYGHALSGNVHKVRLLLGWIGLSYTEVPVDIPAGEQRGAAFLALNPLGQVPVLVEEDGTAIRDSQAILVYLAARYGQGDWWPREPTGQGLVSQWLSFAANEIARGLALARLHRLLGVPADLEAAQRLGEATLNLVDAHLAGREWLELNRPTIADCALLPYVALAGDAGVDLAGHARVRTWIERCRNLPGFVAMPGL